VPHYTLVTIAAATTYG